MEIFNNLHFVLSNFSFNPIAIKLGPLIVSWYSLSYIFGILFAWKYIQILNKYKLNIIPPAAIEYFFTQSIIGIIVGGRIGYVVFYNLNYYYDNPIEIFFLWNGGMSFHGGLIGVIIAQIITSKKYKISFLSICDLTALAAPFGFMLGRIANFINGELYGRITVNPIGIIFPNGGPYPRHPSQLYEAFFEGLVLLILLNSLAYLTNAIKIKGFLTGVFIFLYGTFRFIIEFYREPDDHIGLIYSSLSLGQVLCIPMIVLGIYFLFKSTLNKINK